MEEDTIEDERMGFQKNVLIGCYIYLSRVLFSLSFFSVISFCYQSLSFPKGLHIQCHKGLTP